jgi:hypothetical protein
LENRFSVEKIIDSEVLSRQKEMIRLSGGVNQISKIFPMQKMGLPFSWKRPKSTREEHPYDYPNLRKEISSSSSFGGEWKVGKVLHRSSIL